MIGTEELSRLATRTARPDPRQPEDPLARFMFQQQVTPLFQKLTPANLHPAGLVEMPSTQKVFVIEVRSVELPWKESDDLRNRLSVVEQVRDRAEHELAKDWFNYDNAIARMNYVPTAKGAKKS